MPESRGTDIIEDVEHAAIAETDDIAGATVTTAVAPVASSGTGAQLTSFGR